MKVDGLATDGYTDPDKRVIAISLKAYNSNDYYRIMLHEVMHAIWHECGLDCTKVGLDLEEVIVENFATTINEIFKVAVREPKRPDITLAQSVRDRRKNCP